MVRYKEILATVAAGRRHERGQQRSRVLRLLGPPAGEKEGSAASLSAPASGCQPVHFGHSLWQRGRAATCKEAVTAPMGTSSRLTLHLIPQKKL